MSRGARHKVEESGSNPAGLGPDSRLVYAALLKSDGDVVAARPQLGDDIDVDAALNVLAGLRLIHPVAGDRYDVVSPMEAAEDAVGAREARAQETLQETAELRRTLRELTPLYRSALRAGPSGAGASEILREPEDVMHRLAELAPTIRRSVSSAHPTMAPPEVLEASLASDGELLSRGVQYRQLFTHTARRYHLSVTYLRAMQSLGAQVRTAALIPSRLILIDDEYAVLPVSMPGAAAAIVRDEPVITYLHEIFTFFWEHGQRLTAEQEKEDQVPQEVEIAILHELAEGRTDEAIARRLGISSRTLRRYLSGMFEDFAVDTRFQLGMIATRQGLIGEPAEDEG